MLREAEKCPFKQVSQEFCFKSPNHKDPGDSDKAAGVCRLPSHGSSRKTLSLTRWLIPRKQSWAWYSSFTQGQKRGRSLEYVLLKLVSKYYITIARIQSFGCELELCNKWLCDVEHTHSLASLSLGFFGCKIGSSLPWNSFGWKLHKGGFWFLTSWQTTSSKSKRKQWAEEVKLWKP